jgi:ATP-dependent Lon protease
VPHEQHFTTLYGDTGYSYESILGPYWGERRGREDPYPFVPPAPELCGSGETVVKALTVRDHPHDQLCGEMQLADSTISLASCSRVPELDILDIQLNPNLHDREIRRIMAGLSRLGEA